MSESLRFDGREVPFRAGQTVGAALMADGIASWRTTRRGGETRGLFCGIGVCFDCLVTVDGQRDQRACLVAARDGQDVRTGDPGEALPLPSESSSLPPRTAPGRVREAASEVSPPLASSQLSQEPESRPARSQPDPQPTSPEEDA